MITVIVPIYNAATTLRRCVDSILRQTYRDFELLLINDGSTDTSPQICDEYARQDSRVRVFHKENGGVSSARNVGLDNARGEWITFCDADDWVEECFSDIAQKEYDEDIVCFPFWSMRPEKHVREFGQAEETYSEDKPFRTDWLHTLFRSPWAKLYRRECIGDLRFDDCIKVGEDLTFNLQLLLRSRTCRYVADKPFYCYDEPEVNFSVKYQTLIEQSVYAMTQIFQAYRKLDVQCDSFGPILFTDYKKLCQEDIYKRPRAWYGNEDVQAIYGQVRHHLPLRFRVNYFLMSFPLVNFLRLRFKK